MHFISNKGNGLPVVMVHGNSLSSETWEKQVNATELGHLRMMAIDLPGHGKSSWNPADRPYSLEGFAEAAADFVRPLGECVVVGHSLGAHVAVRVPALAPNVRGLMVTGMSPLRGVQDLGSAFQPTPTLAKAFTAEISVEDARAMALTCTWPGSGYASMFARLFLSADPQVRAGIGAQVAANGLADEHAMIKAAGIPVCVAHGREDELLSWAYLNEHSALFWNGRVHVFDATGHSPQLQRPEAFNALMLDFIRATR